MKRLFFISLTFIMLSSCGPDMGSGNSYKYTIVNNTGKSLKILSYNTQFENPSPKTFFINVNEVITKKGTESLGQGYNFIAFFGGDSLRIIYNNEKVQVCKIPATCPDNNRNPLNFCVYYKNEETFTFTPQDYQNATPCNGNCE